MGFLRFFFLHFLVLSVVECNNVAKQEWSKSTACHNEGKTYKNGEEWIVKDAFVLKCNVKANGYLYEEVVACLMPDGTHLPLDGTPKQQGQNVWTCTKNVDGSGATKEWKMVGSSRSPARKTSPTITSYSVNNKSSNLPSQSIWRGPRCGKQAPGSHWQEKSFELTCDSSGEAKLVACLPKTDKVYRVTVSNSPQKEGDYLIYCQQHTNGAMSLKWQWTGEPTKDDGKTASLAAKQSKKQRF